MHQVSTESVAALIKKKKLLFRGKKKLLLESERRRKRSAKDLWLSFSTLSNQQRKPRLEVVCLHIAT